MPVVIPEVLNNLFAGQPEALRALLAILPQVRRIIISPTIINAGLAPEQTFTCNGVNVGDTVYVSKPTAQAGLGVAGARVTAKDTIGITFVNPTAGNITPTASETYLVAHFTGLASGLINQVP